MSLFLIYSTTQATVLLADSLALKQPSKEQGVVPLVAPKLVHVAPHVFAAHAGTWQPAIAMLSDLRSRILRSKAPSSSRLSNSTLEKIGQTRHAEFERRFDRNTLDVRIALVLTGPLRHKTDREAGRAATIVLWESARNFAPEIVGDHLFFAADTTLSDFAYSCARHHALKTLLQSSPLTVAQALRSIHAAVTRISAQVSERCNVAIVSSRGEASVIEGTLLSLPCDSLLYG